MFSSLAVSNCASFFRKAETTLPKWQLIMWLGRMVWSLVFFFSFSIKFSFLCFGDGYVMLLKSFFFFWMPFFVDATSVIARVLAEKFLFSLGFLLIINNGGRRLHLHSYTFIHTYICSFPNLLKDYDKIKMFLCKWV